MTFSEDRETQLPSLLRVKLKSYFWTLLFGAVFFTIFFSLRAHINLDLGNVMQPGDARMTVVWLSTVALTLIFNKIYFRLNSEVFQSNTQMLRLINKKLDNLHSTIPRLERHIKQIWDYLVTTADQEPFPELPAEGPS